MQSAPKEMPLPWRCRYALALLTKLVPLAVTYAVVDHVHAVQARCRKGPALSALQGALLCDALSQCTRARYWMLGTRTACDAPTYCAPVAAFTPVSVTEIAVAPSEDTIITMSSTSFCAAWSAATRIFRCNIRF
eukprot:911533-Rhodomonas_salina.4